MNNQIDEILSKSKSVAIIGHINPDGDCFGSISGVYDYVKTKFDCIIHCFADCNTVAEEFEPFVNDLIFNPDPLTSYDACICVDTADLNRLGKYTDIFNSSAFTICIDHHSTNTNFAQINLINTRASNCENIYHLLKDSNFTISKSLAGKLFTGIITDTNNLSTNSVTAESYFTVAELKQKGIDSYRIKNFFFGGNSFAQFKILTLAMNSAKFYNNNTIMIMEITQDQMNEVGAIQEDLNPIIGQAFCMKHALCALLISPRNNQTHVSLRAKNNIDVSVIAQSFSGGGHKAAAAFTTSEFSQNDLQYIIDVLSRQINSLPEDNSRLFD